MSDQALTGAGRGHLIVRSHDPLPHFVCVVPVPPTDSSILPLRNTVIAILSGQASASQHHSEHNSNIGKKSKQASRAAGTAEEEPALSYSEHLKLQTVQEWRLKSIVLELNQNAFIAPETRSQLGEGYRPGNGFVLQDDHDGALLEHGDEINVFLREGQTVDSLRLPSLPSRHVYGLPNQPRLNRNGAIIASPDPAQGETGSHFDFVPRAAPILEPSEPSSHSSSVSAHPDAKYETTMRHRSAPAGWHRILVLDSGNGAAQKKVEEEKPQQNVSAVKDGRRSKPKRLLSEGSNVLLGQATSKPAPPARHNSSSYPIGNGQSKDSPANSPGVGVPAQNPPLSSPPLSNREILASQSTANNSMTRAERQQVEKVRKAGQRSLPPQALVIGHGVQGRVGRMNVTEDRRTASHDTSDARHTDPQGEYGNMDAFVSFTAASSEVHQSRSGNGAGTRRMSSRSATSGPEKMAGSSRIATNVHVSKPGLPASPPLNAPESVAKKTVKRYVKIPEKPELPPIRNLAPFDSADEHETLMAMPMPVASPDPSSSSGTRKGLGEMTQQELQMANDAAIALALSESLDIEPSPREEVERTSATNQIGPVSNGAAANGSSRDPRRSAERTVSSPALHRLDSSTSSSSPALTRRSSNSPHLSRDNDEGALSNKAERRYNEVRRALQAEKERQEEHHRIRLQKARRASEEKVETLRKAEQERKQREEKMRWQMWEDVRSRQTKDG